MLTKKKETNADEQEVEDVEETKEESAIVEVKEENEPLEKVPKMEIEKKERKIPTSMEEKKKALLERAKKLKEEKIEEVVSEELKEKVKTKKKEDPLLPLEDYVKSGIYIGTKVVTPDMRKYVYRRRADGLAILNTDIIDKKIKEGIKYLAEFNPENIIVVCKRQAGWRGVRLFSELTGIRVFTKKYPAGILTNTILPDFFETELVIICDPWLDKNALNDAVKVNTKVLMVSDTNNFTKFANQVIIGNNKSGKSLGLIFYLLTKGYLEAKGINKKIPELEFWELEEEEAKRAEVKERRSERFEKSTEKSEEKDLKDVKEEKVEAVYGV